MRSSDNDQVRGEAQQRSLVDIVFARQWTVLASVVFCLLLGCAYAVFAAARYTSTSQFWLEQRGPKLLADWESPSSSWSAYVHAQQEVMRSRPVLELALKYLNETLPPAQVAWKNPASLSESLTIGIVRESGLITVTCEAPDARQAAEVVVAVLRAYETHQKSRRSDVLAANYRLVRNELDRRHTELQLKLKEAHESRQDAAACATDNQDLKPVLEQLTRLSDQLLAAQLECIRTPPPAHGTGDEVESPERSNPAAEKERAIRRLYEQQKHLALSLSTSTAGPLFPDLEVRRLEKSCEALYVRLQELELSRALAMPEITIIDAAQPATVPAGPRMSQVLAISAVFGVLLGGGLSWSQERFARPDGQA